jgi:glycosyltransferase involved in cell wall biosynthesis
VTPAPSTVLYVQSTSEVGGSDIALLRLVERLDQRRFRPLAVLPGPGPLVRYLERAGAVVHLLPMVQLRSTLDLRHQSAFVARFRSSVRRIAQLAREEEATLVHSNSLFTLYGAPAAARAKLPHVWHVRELPNLLWPLQTLLVRSVEHRSARVVVVSDAVGRTFLAHGARKPAKTIRLYEGVDTMRFRPSVSGGRIRRELGIEGGAPLVGFVGRLDPWKGCDVFLRMAHEVARTHRDVQFLVCGGSLPGFENHVNHLAVMASELGLGTRVHFTQWRYVHEDIAEVMAALDVFVHTSVKPEPFGFTIVEAMATGTPVVASRCGGVPEIVTSGLDGLLVEPGDAAGCAAAVRSILDDDAMRIRFAHHERERVEQCFDIDRYVDELQDLYEEIIAQCR